MGAKGGRKRERKERKRMGECVCVRVYLQKGGYLNWQLGTMGERGVRGNGGCWGEPIANICWLAGSGEMDCSGTVSERQFHHHLYGPVHLVFLEHWGDLLVKGREEKEREVEET